MDEPTTPAPRCEAHNGAHALYLGACYAFGAQVKRPASFRARPIFCQTCGAEQDAVKLPGGRVLFVMAGTDDRHYHAPDHAADKLDLVAEGLGALQATLGAMLAERRAARTPKQTVEATPSTRQGECAPLGGVPTLT